jgi:anti-sigma factor RsiW
MAMSETGTPSSEREEIEMLLPWYATGRLEPNDMARVEAFLERHPDVARQLDLVAAEREATIASNDAIRLPRGLTADALLARIGAEERRTPAGALRGVFGTITQFFSAPTATGVRWAAAAAALLLAVQLGVIGSLSTELARRPDPGGFTTASGGAGAAADGAFALVRFTDSATAAQISAELLRRDMAIAEGPKPGGLFLVRIGPARLTVAERDAKISELRQNGALVGLVTPATR